MADYDKGLLPALDRLRARWPMIAWTCGIAAVSTLVVSVFLTREYTAVSRIVIEPPAGSDPRTSMAVSPIYLESLRKSAVRTIPAKPTPPLPAAPASSPTLQIQWKNIAGFSKPTTIFA